MEENITLDYGSGGLRTAELIDRLIVPAFQNDALTALGDGAVLANNGAPLVFSTDSFVVAPWRFPAATSESWLSAVQSTMYAWRAGSLAISAFPSS